MKTSRHTTTGTFSFTVVFLFFLLLCVNANSFANLTAKDSTYYSADHPYFKYTGRVDFSTEALPKFWAPGVHITAKFKGTFCEVFLNDEVLWDKSHNYVSIVIDHGAEVRIKLKEKENRLVFDGLANGNHTIVICKSTESGIGYLEFAGLRCAKLLKPGLAKKRRIEFIGNSITCGTGSDESAIRCDQGEWYDQHNAYQSYGPLTARALDAEWVLSAVSGIGLIRSCCDMDITMPDVFDKVNMRENEITWDFKSLIPDVVTVCLGQNDGIQDSAKFCAAYTKFLETIRKQYPKASVVMLTSPMADEKLSIVQKKYISGIHSEMVRRGDKNVSMFFFSKSFNNGCGGHPDLQQHRQISAELTEAIRKIKNW